ncbi:MAG: glycosyltransferase [Cyanobacteria bacterium P01_A01_bin.84]
MRTILKSRYFHPSLLLIWFTIGISLRLLNLDAKPLWTDEFSTLVFSLGNSFLNVPINEIISVNTLLQPLQPQAGKGIQDVIHHLFTESNHPPIYFILTHLWTKLFPTQQGLVSVWGARSLSAIFGVLSIPAIYSLSYLGWRSRLIAHLSAALMAVSPFGIFLAQEARHYTLAILWVIASLACLIVAARCIRDRTSLPMRVGLSWVIINAFGIASHYFFVLTLFAESIALIFLAYEQWQQSDFSLSSLSFLLNPTWKRIYTVAIATAISGLVWLPIFLQNSYGNKLTDWIQGERTGFAWVSPLFQALAAWITMISLLPVEAPQLTVVIISGLIMIGFFIWVTPILLQGIKINLRSEKTSFITQLFIAFCLGAICLFFFFTYFLGIDLTRGARYNFAHFPAVIILIASSLSIYWQNPTINPNINKGKFQTSGKKAVTIVLIMGLLSSITVTFNLGYQKYYRPDLFLNLMQEVTQKKSPSSILIATTQRTHVQIGEMMGIAREFKVKEYPISPPQFFLAHQEKEVENATINLEKALNKLPHPFDLWLVNFHTSPPKQLSECKKIDRENLPDINGYEYQIYRCE